MRKTWWLAFLVTSCVLHAAAQATRDGLDPLLKQPLGSPVLVAEELRQFMLKRVPELPTPANAEAWQKESERLRAHELSVVYHGWPQAWVDAKPNRSDASSRRATAFLRLAWSGSAWAS
jgi:hypothetical protein